MKVRISLSGNRWAFLLLTQFDVCDILKIMILDTFDSPNISNTSLGFLL